MILELYWYINFNLWSIRDNPITMSLFHTMILISNTYRISIKKKSNLCDNWQMPHMRLSKILLAYSIVEPN